MGRRRLDAVFRRVPQYLSHKPLPGVTMLKSTSAGVDARVKKALAG